MVYDFFSSGCAGKNKKCAATSTPWHSRNDFFCRNGAEYRVFVSEFFLEKGYLRPISKMVSSQLAFAVVLVALGYWQRRKNLVQHKTNMLMASLWLIQPGMDRWVDHIFPSIFLELWLAVYAVLFAAIIWYYKRVSWQLWVGFLIWLAGLINAISRNDF